jgi:formylglycine-generating enzyme
MTLKASPPATAFAKALRSLETGGLTYSDVLDELREIIATGASPTELLEILRARELVEPLSDPAHSELLGLLNDAIVLEKRRNAAAAEAQNARPEAASNSAQERVPATTSIPGPTLVHTSTGIPAAGQRASTLTTRTLSSLAVAPGPHLVSNQGGLSKLEAAAVARAAALAAELPVVQAALESERSKNREMARASARALADGVEAAEAARAMAEKRLREFERSSTEAQKLRDLLAAREAQLAAVRADHAKTVPILEARDTSIAQLETDLQAVRARESALSADLAVARSGLELEQRNAQARYKSLADKLSSTEAALGLAQEALGEAERHQTEARTWRDSIAALDSQLAALTREHAKIVAALDARSKSGAQLETDLQAARARTEEALREAERHRTEARALRDSITARDAELAALTGEHAKIKAALDARSKSGSGLEADLQAARARTEQALREAERHQTEARTLRDSLATRDAELAAARKEHAKTAPLLKAREKSIAQLETDLLAARARADALSMKLSQKSAGNPASASAPLAAQTPRQQSAQIADVAAVPASRTQQGVAGRDKSAQELFSGSVRGIGATVRANARVIGLGVAVILAAVAAWMFTHRASVPSTPNTSATSSTAAQIPGEVIRDCPTCPAVTVLPAGRFKQGTPNADRPPSIETPQHWVSIRRPFGMSTNAVTVDEYAQFIEATGRNMQGCETYDGTWKNRPEKDWAEPGFIQSGRHPVTCVSWTDAQSYATWLSAKTGHRYRLPSASEWEYAARAGGEAVQPWGANGSSACANANVADRSAAHRYPGWQVFACDDGYIYTSPVGSFVPNSFGLNDMLGNVFQWTEDCWHADYAGAPVDGSARTDGDCTSRELRGGSWFSSPDYVRANYRNHFAADYRTSSVGIRLVREVGP